MPRTKGAKADKLWADALRLAVNREEKDEGRKRKRLSIIADKLCRAAMGGDVQAIREIGDRLDGKPQQAVQLGGDEDNPISLTTQIERKIVKADN